MIVHSVILCLQRAPKLTVSITHRNCWKQDGCHRNGCAVATTSLFLSLLTDSSLAFVFLRIYFLSITSTAEYFLSHLTRPWAIETWTLRECKPHTFNPRSPEAVSVWGMKAESHIGVYFFLYVVSLHLFQDNCASSALPLVITCCRSSSHSCSGWFRYKLNVALKFLLVKNNLRSASCCVPLSLISAGFETQRQIA